MASTLVIGSTGLVGSYVLTNLLNLPSIGTVHTVSRRAPKDTADSKLRVTVEPDTALWTSKLPSLSPKPTTIISSLGTTRAAAGGIANQWKIDHDLNVDLARAAKEAGVRNFVFVSSAGTRGMLSSRAPYSKMKIGVEDKVKELDFEHAVIVRPGLIIGDREKPHTGMGPVIGLARTMGRWFGPGSVDWLGQEAEVIARATVQAARMVEEGKAPSKYWILEQADIVRLGRTEWKS